MKIIPKDLMMTVDCETTLNNEVGSNKASPFSSKNRIVLAGLKCNTYENMSFVKYNGLPINIFTGNVRDALKMIAGQNLKFDLHHMRKGKYTIDYQKLEDWLVEGRVWDTQLAEYLLTGQAEQFASLNTLCTKYGLPIKNDEVTKLFEAGIGADGIDEKILQDYLEHDVRSTEQIAIHQILEADKRGILPFIMAMMDALIAVEDIEYNGIKIDVEALKKYRDNLAKEIETIELEFLNELGKLHSELSFHFNTASREHVSALLFGGEIKWTTREIVGKYKNGKDKYGNQEHTIKLPRLISDKYSEPTSKPGVFKVDEEVLETIAGLHTTLKDALSVKVAKTILKLRGKQKELGTYYDGLAKLIHEDGLLHPNIHMTNTDTGRTSSSEPNSQNIPSSDDSQVKKLFVSRFGNKGVIVSADYNQIEVIALAWLCRDPQLILDIINGVDIHSVLASIHYGFGKTITKEMRRVIKTINFGLIYGGTAGGLATQAGITKEEAQQAIDNFYKRYPVVKLWQHSNIQIVLTNALGTPPTGVTKKGLPSRQSYLILPTGRTFTFKEYDNPWMRGDTSFSPTQIKNYPVQGFATGDLVLTMLGVLWRKLKKEPKLKDKCFMVNVVHDEYVLDVHEDVLSDVLAIVKTTLEDTPKYLKQIYDINFDLPTRVNVSAGPNWKDQTNLT